MAAVVVSPTVIEANTSLGRRLFEGIKFWLSAKVPQRTRFINDIKANGGEVLPLEKNANVKIVDHARKETPTGTHSYTYIEQSIRHGTLEDLEDHAVGPVPGTIRNVGSIVQPPKSTRKKYTQEDERILWDWVNTNPQKSGGTDGNEIYKQLEAKHPQHPWQSWRDHWIKSMKGKARPIYPPNNGPPTPPSEMQSAVAGPAQRAVVQGVAAVDEFHEFSERDVDALLEQGQYFLDVPEESIADAWEKWVNEADLENKHSAEHWQAFWEQNVRPRFLRDKERTAREAAVEQRKFPKVSVVVNQNPSVSASPSKGHDKATIPARSPSYHPESPELRSPSPEVSLLSMDKRVTSRSPEQMNGVGSPLGSSILKRKRIFSEELPSSPPPPVKTSPLPNRTVKRPKEIASTPDASPQRRGEKNKYEPLFLENEFEAETDRILRDSQQGADSPLGQQASESLSEPDRTLRGSTQALFRDVTPFVGFELPPPEGGWNSDEEAENADKSESESQYETALERRALPNTQSILESSTQMLDLAVPDPEQWPTIHPPSSPPSIMPSSPLAAESESSTAQQAQLDAQIDTLITDHVARGFAAEQVLMVLNSTCTDIQLAKHVLKQMGPQEGEIRLPENVRGVWTERDDEDLNSSDARKVSRLETKHGSHKFNARYEWLQLMAVEEEGEEEDDEP